MPASLDYRTAAARKPFRFDFGYPIALICALLPMLIGTGAFVGWYLAGDEAFMFLGLFTIFGGVILFLCGLICLILYSVGETAHQTMTRRRFAGRITLSAFLLLFNFPLAAFYMGFVDSIAIVVEVRNQGSKPMRAAQLVAPHEVIVPIGDVAPGQAVRGRIGATGDGELALQWTDATGAPRQVSISGYVTNGDSGTYRVDIADNSQNATKVK